MVGPWQVPVADCAVTLADYSGFAGEAMSMGERTPLAALDAPASGRMAVAEAITNLLAAPIELPRVKLSANWMAACGEPGEDAALYDTVRAVGMELCPALGIAIPVGKDSLSMRTQWRERRRAPEGDLAGEPDRQRLRHAGRRARHADAAARCDARHHAGADRPGPGPAPHGRQHPGAGDRPGRQPGATACPTWTTRRTWSRPWWTPSTSCARRASSWPTTTAATAACWRPCARWPLPATSACALNVDLLVTEGDGIADSRADVGDTKNWAAQVSERRDELTLKALFNEELGVVLQVQRAERDDVMQGCAATA